jgi:hypothetical protein
MIETTYNDKNTVDIKDDSLTGRIERHQRGYDITIWYNVRPYQIWDVTYDEIKSSISKVYSKIGFEEPIFTDDFDKKLAETHPETYVNPWHNPNNSSFGPKMFESYATPIEYMGFQIYERVEGLVWDVVKHRWNKERGWHDMCLDTRPSLEAAKKAIDIIWIG